MSKNEYGGFPNTKLLMKPGFHIVGNDHKRKGKFILWAKNKLRHEYQNLITKNAKPLKDDQNEHLNILNIFQTPKKYSIEEDDFNTSLPFISFEESKEGSSSRRIKHPKIILPEK